MAALDQTFPSGQALHYLQSTYNIVRNSTSQLLHAALVGFATFSLPSFNQIAEASQTNTGIQHSQAVLPLPFASRGFIRPWVISTSSGLFEQSAIQSFDSRADRLIDVDSDVIVLVESRDGYAFAHEAPAYFSDKEELYFCSNAGGLNGRSNATSNNAVFRINLNNTITRARNNVSSFTEDVHRLEIDNDNVQMTNGATPYQNQLLLVNSGRTEQYPPTLVLVDRFNPSQVHTLLNNAAGKQFNSLNDAKVNFHRGSIYFTDASYGYSQNFRPKVDLAKAIWRFDPITARLTMLDASLVTPNGIAISKDGHKVYVTETGSNVGGDWPTRADEVPSVIYVFDVIYKANTEFLENKRIFAYVPVGVADGINVDLYGNVYSCTGDGLYAWDSDGLLLMRIFIPEGCASFTFVGKGRIVLMAQQRIYLVQLAKHVEGLSLDTYPRMDRRITIPFPT